HADLYPDLETGEQMGRLIARCAVWGVGILLVLVAVFPLLWALLNSLKTLLDIVTPTPRFLFTPTLDNYRQVIGSPEVLVGLTNS
ncbi:hypothetical protein, partial [Enterococcus casseliflavus]|uniref:hypothetical protein n=1 Tax=Enterococcus casseliflavus TaxID=37734 RepID=UPI003D0AF02F